MIARLIQNRQHIPLDLRQVRRQQPIHPPGRGGAFQGVAVHVVQGVPGDAAHADLAVLRRQIPLQIPVAQVAVFRVDLPHDSHLLDFTGHPLHRPEFGRHLPAAAQDLPAGESSIPRQILSQVLRPAAPECLRRAGDCLVWPGLVPQQGQRVPPHGSGQTAADHGGGDGQPGAPVDAPDIETQGPQPVQHPPQQADAAGAPALVPRLAEQHPAPGRVVPPGPQGGQHLPRHQEHRIAQLIVEIFQPQLRQMGIVLRQQHRLPFLRRKGVLQQGEPIVQQGGDQQRLPLCHPGHLLLSQHTGPRGGKQGKSGYKIRRNPRRPLPRPLLCVKLTKKPHPPPRRGGAKKEVPP